MIEDIRVKLKTKSSKNINLILVDNDGIDQNTNRIWTESL